MTVEITFRCDDCGLNNFTVFHVLSLEDSEYELSLADWSKDNNGCYYCPKCSDLHEEVNKLEDSVTFSPETLAKELLKKE
jgi:hypothetical protein